MVQTRNNGSKFVTKPLKLKRNHFTLERVKWFWIFDAQIALVPASLSSTGGYACFNESFLSSQVDI